VQINLVIDFKVDHDIYMAIVREALYCVVKTLLYYLVLYHFNKKQTKNL